MAADQRRPVGGSPEAAVVCVRDRGEPCPVQAVVEYQPEGCGIDPGHPDRGRRRPGRGGAAPAAASAGGAADRAGHGRGSSGGWRPGRGSDPALTGTVTDPHRRLRNQRGKETTLIQLRVRRRLRRLPGLFGEPGYLVAEAGRGLGAWGAGRAGTLADQRLSWGRPAPVANVAVRRPHRPGADRVRSYRGDRREPVGEIPLPVPYEVRRPRTAEPGDRRAARGSSPARTGWAAGRAGRHGRERQVGARRRRRPGPAGARRVPGRAVLAGAGP